MRKLFEAASWAASSFNEQPWRFIVATQAQPEAFAKILGLLSPRNQQWAKTAWAIGFTAGKKTFTQTGGPDRFGLHDTGAASENLALQATADGLHAHFMGGFDAQLARAEFHVPDDFDIGAAFAFGYIDEEKTRPGDRKRKTLDQIVFGGEWGQPAEIFGE
jgi:nitroreductase